MNKKQAEDFIYKSYIKAQRYQDYNLKDSKKRRNDLTFDLIRKKSNTPSVVVTGSKGKGSVSKMISQILQTKYTVGLMTSPHIVDFCERFQVNGGKISTEDFIKHICFIAKEIDDLDALLPKHICISPMGIQTYMALHYFEEKETQFNIFECGKGAKYDDVNNVKHEYAVINTIFLEHTRELGKNIEEIAEDKVHVITGEQKCVYVAKQEKKVLDIIEKQAARHQVSLKVYGKDFFAENIKYTKEGMVFDVTIGEEKIENITIPLLGEHQAMNCAIALTVCKDIFNNEILWKNKSLIKENLRNINWPGRMEVLSQSPFMMLDACINSASCENVIRVLDYLNIEKTILIVGIPDDKDYIGVVHSMKKKAIKTILTKSQNPHYIFTKKQQEKLKEQGIETTWTSSVKEAIAIAKNENYPIVILGTTSVVAEVKNEYM
ncbi:MAG: bifunctional protein FolC [Lachnospiraceae bacterium]|nr:bifunctional protein FolC [Lachnospiraceae bacterium]